MRRSTTILANAYAARPLHSILCVLCSLFLELLFRDRQLSLLAECVTHVMLLPNKRGSLSINEISSESQSIIPGRHTGT